MAKQPQTNECRLNVYIHAETLKRAKMEAVRQDKTLNKFVQEALEKFLESRLPSLDEMDRILRAHHDI